MKQQERQDLQEREEGRELKKDKICKIKMNDQNSWILKKDKINKIRSCGRPSNISVIICWSGIKGRNGICLGAGTAILIIFGFLKSCCSRQG